MRYTFKDLEKVVKALPPKANYLLIHQCGGFLEKDGTLTDYQNLILRTIEIWPNYKIEDKNKCNILAKYWKQQTGIKKSKLKLNTSGEVLIKWVITCLTHLI